MNKMIRTIVWPYVKFILTIIVLITGWIVFQLLDLITLRALSSFREGLSESTGELKPIDICGWFRSLSWGKRTAICCVIGGAVICVFRGCESDGVGRSKQVPMTDGHAASKLKQYQGMASDQIEFSILSGCDNSGAFGFIWGELPRNKEYRVPCIVTYRIANKEFPILELMYGRSGLAMISLKRSLGPTINIPSELTNEAQVEWKKSMVETSVPLIENLHEIALQCTGQDVRWCVLGNSLVGLSTEDDRCHYLVGIRVDLPCKENREQVLFVSHMK